MSLLTASLDFVQHNKLEVLMCNVSSPDADRCSVIASLRSSHPDCFSVVGSELPDCILRPGQRHALLLEVVESGLCSDVDLNKKDASINMTEMPHCESHGCLNQMSIRSSVLSSMHEEQPTFSAAPPVASFYHIGESQMGFNSNGSDNLVSSSVMNGKSRRLQLHREGTGTTSTLEEAAKYKSQPHEVLSTTKIKGDHGDECSVRASSSLNFDPKSSTSSSTRNASRLSILHTPQSTVHLKGSMDTTTWSCVQRRASIPDADDEIIKSNESTASHNRIFPAAHRYNNCGSDHDGTLRSQILEKSVKLSSLSSQNFFFFVYYERIGDENGCLLAANKWIRMERYKHFLLQERMLSSKQQKQSDGVSGGGQADKKKNFRMPPVLGGPVRWLKDVDVSYVSSSLQGTSRGSYSRSSEKMFRKKRLGGGCVMLTCRLPREDAGVVMSWRTTESDTQSNPVGLSGSGFDVQVQPAKPCVSSDTKAEAVKRSAQLNNNNYQSIDSAPPFLNSGENSFINSSRDLCSLLFPSSPNHMEGADSQNAGPNLSSSPRYHHARTETDMTVTMLDHTVCCGGNENFICADENMGKKRPADVEDIRGTAVDPSPRKQQHSSGASAKPKGVFSRRAFNHGEQRNTLDTDAGRSLKSVRSPVRSRQLQRDNDSSLLRRAEPTTLARWVNSSHSAERIKLRHELGLMQVGDVVRNLVVTSGPFMQTAIEGTVNTVSSSARLIADLVENSVDILYAVCTPILIVLSLCLLWVIFDLKPGDSMLDVPGVLFS